VVTELCRNSLHDLISYYDYSDTASSGGGCAMQSKPQNGTSSASVEDACSGTASPEKGMPDGVLLQVAQQICSGMEYLLTTGTLHSCRAGFYTQIQSLTPTLYMSLYHDTYVHTYTSMRPYIHTYAYALTHVRTHVHIHTQVRIYIHV
jgi:hypothetical protein